MSDSMGSLGGSQWRRYSGGAFLAFRVAQVAWFGLAMTVLLSPSLGAPAESVSWHERVVPRKIIALYDGAVDNWQETLIHRMAEKPLNHLGLVLEPHDIREPLPDLADRADVRGVLTWWQGSSVTDPIEFVRWATRAIDSGKRFVILGEFGLRDEESNGHSVPRHLLGSLLGRLGLRYRDRSYDQSFTAKATVKTAGMVEYERALPIGLPLYEAVQQLDNSTRVYLRAMQPGYPVPADLVVTGPAGGYVATGYTHYLDSNSSFRKWYINPFAFFRESFSTDELPKPDVTTAVGRRIYFSHIDGDGWRSASEVQPYRANGGRAIDVLIGEVFTVFPNLPVTVAPIAGDLDPDWCGDKAAQDAARRAFALPHVEPATHTYSHPFTWAYYANGHPEEEEVGQRNCVGGSLREIERAYLKLPFDLSRELEESARHIERFLPPGKCVTLLQWSGDTTPFPQAISAAAKSGLANINGGDARFDAKYPSVAWVAPVGRLTSGGLQVYAAASNENTYTAEWSDEYYGFAQLEETLKNTETPRRLLPINVYYHAYSGEKLASLNALLKNLRFVEEQEVAPITATAYVDIARGFYSTQLTLIGPRVWRVEHRGAMNTLRFDDVPNSSVDLRRSSGVLGWRRHGESLYVSLDPAFSQPVVALTDPANEAAMHTSWLRPVLVHSRWLIQDLRIVEDRFAFSAAGFGPGEMVWSVPKPGRYSIIASDGEQQHRQEVERDEDSKIRFRIPATGPGRASVRVTWQSQTSGNAFELLLDQDSIPDPPLPPFIGQARCNR